MVLIATASLAMATQQEVILWNATTLSIKSEQERADIAIIIDDLGRRSALAQGLRTQITSYQKLINSGHSMYAVLEGSEPLGFIKVGTKHLYHYDKKGKIIELDPLSALDFYVCEQHQRKGIGDFDFPMPCPTFDDAADIIFSQANY